MSHTPGSAGEHTRAVSLPEAPVPSARPMRMPVHRATTYAFDTSQEFADVMGGVQDGYSYARIDNPTTDAFADAIAALEGAGLPDRVCGQAFASGMAAISTVLLALTEAGAHVVASRSIYGNTYSLLDGLLRRFGVRTDFVDITDLDAVRAALTPDTRVVFTETLSNPAMTVSDLPGLARICQESGAALVVDSTFASPVVCRPLEFGADVVVHSATKYLGGHSDTTGGAAVAAPALIERVRAARIDLGACLAPDEAYLLHRGLETLPLRVQRQCETAETFATALEGHPAVERVDHPSLASHPEHVLAGKMFDAGRYGAVVTVHPKGGRAEGLAFADRLKVATIAASLGGTHTLACHVASTSHRSMNEAELAAAGVSPGAVRFSIGLEDPQDLIDDVLAALDGGN